MDEEKVAREETTQKEKSKTFPNTSAGRKMEIPTLREIDIKTYYNWNPNCENGSQFLAILRFPLEWVY